MSYLSNLDNAIIVNEKIQKKKKKKKIKNDIIEKIKDFKKKKR